MKFFKIASFFLLLAAIFGIVLAAPADKNAVEKAVSCKFINSYRRI